MTILDTLIGQCTAALGDTPDAVLTLRADTLLVIFKELQRFNAELPMFRVGELVPYGDELVKVYGVVKAGDPHDRYWYRVGSKTIAEEQVREKALGNGKAVKHGA